MFGEDFVLEFVVEVFVVECVDERLAVVVAGLRARLVELGGVQHFPLSVLVRRQA